MTSLDFLYIALGSGFLLLMVFLSVLILHMTILLRDVNKIVEDMRLVTGRIKETVYEPFKALSEMTASFGFISEIIEKIRARYAEHMEEAEEDVAKEPKKKSESRDKSGFLVKKLNK